MGIEKRLQKVCISGVVSLMLVSLAGETASSQDKKDTVSSKGAFLAQVTSAVPGKPQLLSPSGMILGSTVAFTWKKLPDCPWYFLWVNGPTGPKIQSWYTEQQAGCQDPTAQNCTIMASLDLEFGAGMWWVAGYNSAGQGPWSDSMLFALNKIPGYCKNTDIGETNLLFPYVSTASGYDTGIVISNTGKDPFGTTGRSGTCTAFYFGNKTVQEQTSEVIQPGSQLTFDLYGGGGIPNSPSAVPIEFRGYMIVKCRFPYAHGMAFIAPLGTQQSVAYLPLVICDTRTPVEQLLH